MGLELRAEHSEIVSADEVVVDERVRAKCIYPKCSHYGTNINCPPHAPDLDFIRKLVANYQYGIFFAVKAKSSDFAGPNFRKRAGKKNPAKIIFNTICAEIESRSFYEGYYHSLAFGQGPCKTFWCSDQACSALQDGQACRFSNKARSSMEAVGIDAFAMVAREGWDIYPCGSRVDQNKIPHVLLVGLVFII